MNRALLSLSLFCLSLFSNVWSHSVWAQELDPTTQESYNKDVPQNNTISVTVKPLSELVFEPIKKVPARAVSLQNSVLSAQISALISDITVQTGDAVERGQVLIRLECTDYELNKQRILAEKKALDADYQFAQYQYQRSTKLLKSKSVSQELQHRQASQVGHLAAQRQALQIKIRQAEKDISRCQIKAPFAGVIIQRLVHQGEYVAPHSPMIKLLDTHNVEVEVQVPIALINDLDHSTPYFIYRQKPYPLSLRAIIPNIETRARHQRVRLSFTAKKTLPDAYGMVEIHLHQREIPANYIVQRNKQQGIFLLKKEPQQPIARFYELKHALAGRSAVIDLPMDSLVIVSGRQALSDGQPVHIETD